MSSLSNYLNNTILPLQLRTSHLPKLEKAIYVYSIYTYGLQPWIAQNLFGDVEGEFSKSIQGEYYFVN